MTPERKVRNLREDLMDCASQLQNHPEIYLKAMVDADTWKEASTLVGNLVSLFEVIQEEAKEGEPKP